MHFLDTRTRAGEPDVIRISSKSEAPLYFGFSDSVDNSADEQRERARLRVCFEMKLQEFFDRRTIRTNYEEL